MDVTVLTAVTGVWEAPLVTGLERSRSGVVVVRRCADLTDLLAAASTGQARAVLLSADLRRLDRTALDRLASAGVAVVGLSDPDEAVAPDGHRPSERRLRQLGVRHVAPADAAPEQVVDLVQQAVQTVGADQAVGSDRVVSRALADPAAALAPSSGATEQPAGADDSDHAAEPSAVEPGGTIAVWGPTGAPGRTTVAVTLAAELAAAGSPTVLVDADTYGASVAQVLGLLDEAPGLAAACRAASTGTLDLTALARLAPQVSDDLRVLTGVSRAARWPEVPGGPLSEVLTACRALARWTVVDTGPVLESDEEISFDSAAPRRNAATLTALEQADTVLVVGGCDPLGLQRLVRGLQDLLEAVPGVSPRVVVTRVRASAVGASPRRQVVDALARYAGVHDVVLVPDDRASCDAALLAGRTLTEHAPSSPARAALAELATDLAGLHRPPARRARRSARLLR